MLMVCVVNVGVPVVSDVTLVTLATRGMHHPVWRVTPSVNTLFGRQRSMSGRNQFLSQG